MGAEAWCDGAAMPNPGATGIGYVIRQPGLPDIEYGAYHGWGTNNEAELKALELVAARLRSEGVDEALLHSDSKVAIGWFRPPAGLRVRWVRRNENARADALANGATGNRLEQWLSPSGQRRHRRWRGVIGEWTSVRNGYTGERESVVRIEHVTEADSGQPACRITQMRRGTWSRLLDGAPTGTRIDFEAIVTPKEVHKRGARRILWNDLQYPRNGRIALAPDVPANGLEMLRQSA